MATRSQGTELYLIDPADDSVMKVGFLTGINPGGSPADQLDTTTLDDTESTSMRGLRKADQATVALNTDLDNESHFRMYELSQSDDDKNLKFVIGWPNGRGIPPTATAQEFTLPDTRTWMAFEGYFSNFPFNFETNSILTSEVTIQRSGKAVITRKTV